LHRRPRDGRTRGSARLVLALILALLLAACGSTATPVPSGATGQASVPASAGPGTSAPPSESGTPGEPASAAPTEAASAGPSEGSTPSAPASASAPASPPAGGSVAPLPAPGPAHRFSCASLLSGRQVSSITRIPSVLFVPAGAESKLPKGETECKYTGSKRGPGRTFLILTTDVTILTGGARATFDATWAQVRGTPFVSTVDGIGDDAAWDASHDTLVGIAGRTAFVVTLEPSPRSIFTPASALAATSSLARILVAHL